MATSKRKTGGPSVDSGDAVSVTETVVISESERDTNYGEFFGFNHPNTVFSFDKGGNAISRKLAWLEEPAVARAIGNQFRLPLRLANRETALLPLGLIVVSGDTGVGKSSFVRALANAVPIQRFLAVEPHDSPDEIETVPSFATIDAALVAAVQMSYRHPDVMHVLDSLRAPLFEMSGAAGSKGVIMPFFTQLTRVSNHLAKAGITIMATVNPMDSDKDYVAAFLSKLSAAVPATILLTSARRSDGTARFEGTLSSRPTRTAEHFVFETGITQTTQRDSMLSAIEFDPLDTSIPLINNTLIKSLKGF